MTQTSPTQVSTLDGTFNFRDVGGMPAAGGSIRHGVLYRSDALSGLTPEGLAQLVASPIGTVVDFRTSVERQMAPDRLPTERAITLIELPMLQGEAQGAARAAGAAGGTNAEPTDPAAAAKAAIAGLPTLPDMYVGMLKDGGAAFAKVAELIAAETPGAPHDAVVLHCTAGKDRTGVSTALMLLVAGADRDAVVADYAASAANLAGPWADRMVGMVEQMGATVTPELREVLTGTPASAIETALAWVEANHGSAAAYLAANGVDAATLAALRDRLFEPAA